MAVFWLIAPYLGVGCVKYLLYSNRYPLCPAFKVLCDHMLWVGSGGQCRSWAEVSCLHLQEVSVEEGQWSKKRARGQGPWQQDQVWSGEEESRAEGEPSSEVARCQMRIWWVQIPCAEPTEKQGKQGAGWCLRFGEKSRNLLQQVPCSASLAVWEQDISCVISQSQKQPVVHLVSSP